MTELPGPLLGPQTLFLASTYVPEVLFGGSRGPGKTHCLLLDYLQDVKKYGKHWKGLLVRQTFPQLEEIIAKSYVLFAHTDARYNIQSKTWTFPDGATLKFRSVANARDASQFQGHEYAWIGIDEIGNYEDYQVVNLLRACLRGSPCPTARIRLTANPGGPCHSILKQMYVDPAPSGLVRLLKTDEYVERMYIPAKLTDNPVLMDLSPDYAENLKYLGSPELVRAWLEGDWNVLMGAFYPEISKAKHWIKSFNPPDEWVKFITYDWGTYSPSAVTWWTIATGDPVRTSQGIVIMPRGALVCYREWYIAKLLSGSYKGLLLTNEQMADGIVERSKGDKNLRTGRADRAFFKREGTGFSCNDVFQRKGLHFRRADDSRIPGWNQVRSRLVGGLAGFPEGIPGIYFMDYCPHTFRTMAGLQRDETNNEDASEGEDHAPDTVRYACNAVNIPLNLTIKQGVPKDSLIAKLPADLADKYARVFGLDI